MRELSHVVGPLLSAPLVEPHATDVFQETRGALYAAFIGEVQLVATRSNHGIGRLDAHQAPSATRQVGEMLVTGRHGSDRRSCVVTCYSHHGHGTQPRHALNLLGELTNNGSWLHHPAELLTAEPHRCQQLRREVLRAWVEHLRRRSDGIFANSLAREHIGQCVGHEQYLLCLLEGYIAFTTHSMQLEQRVEVHELYAGDAIHLLAVQDMIEIIVNRLEGVRIAIGKRIAKQASVTADAHEVYTPSVNADTLDFDATLGHQPQPTDHFIV